MKIHVYASPRYITVVHDDGGIFQVEPHELGLGGRSKKETESIAILTALENNSNITEVYSDSLSDLPLLKESKNNFLINAESENMDVHNFKILNWKNYEFCN